jgi:hypothetical protein
MQAAAVSVFGGAAGKVMLRAHGLTPVINGLVATLGIGLPVWTLASAGMEDLGFLPPLVLLPLLVARCGLNARAGEWNGLVLSASGGPWSQVAGIAFRYLVLMILWALPLTLLTLSLSKSFELRTSIGGVPALDGIPALPSLYLLTGLFFHPAALIVALESDGIGEALSPSRWSELFAGRVGEVLLISALVMAGLFLAMMPLFAILPALVGGSFAANMTFAAVVTAYLVGWTLGAFGGLCGAFCDVGAQEVDLSSAPPVSEPPRVSPPNVFEGPAEAAPDAAPVAGSAGPTEARPRTIGSAEIPARVEGIRQRLAGEPAKAAAELASLYEQTGPHAALLHAWTLALVEAGEEQRAVEVAREALPFLLSRGATPLAASLVPPLAAHLQALRLTPAQVSALGGALKQQGDLADATRLYAAAVREDPQNAGAVKSLLQIAEQLLRDDEVKRSIKVYRFLLRHCAGSPLELYMRDGLATAERRAAHQAAPAAH